MPDSDYLVKAVTKDGAFRAIAISSKKLTEEARQRHNLSHTAAVALGRAFACCILLCNTLRKTKGHLSLKIKGDGPLGSVIADASNEGTIRGYVEHGKTECFDKKGYVDIDKAIGKVGYVHVSYDNERGIPYNGSVELTSGEIAKDIVNYLAASEQISSFISCGVYLEPTTGKVLQAGGILIQRMSQATDDDVKLLEDTVTKLDPFSILLRAGLSLEQIIKKALINFDIDIVSEFEGLCFHCGCNYEKFESAVVSLGQDEIKKIIKNMGYAEGRCHFCNNIYIVKRETLEKLVENSKN